MIRQVRIGLAVALSFILALVTFMYLWTSPLWTSRNASSHTDESSTSSESHQKTDEIESQQTQDAHPNPTDVHKAKNLSVDWIRPLTLNKHHRAPAMPQQVVVQAGDCLWSIARRYHTTVQAIMAENNLMTTLLHAGQALHISTTSVEHIDETNANQPLMYTVRPGDTLWSISIEYGVSTSSLESTNHISATSLHVGERLQIDAPQAHYHRTPASAKLIASAPDNLIPVYKAAGQKYGIPWTVLAAIHKEETDFDTTGTRVSCVGAQGPMQFMPSTFQIFGVPAPGHTHADIHNVYDAIYSTAHMLAATGFQQDPYHAIYLYNHSVSYVDDILRMSAV